jgi:hypothetical protein
MAGQTESATLVKLESVLTVLLLSSSLYNRTKYPRRSDSVVVCPDVSSSQLSVARKHAILRRVVYYTKLVQVFNTLCPRSHYTAQYIVE